MKLKSIICIPLLLLSLSLSSFSNLLSSEVFIVKVENLTPKLFRTYMLSSLENENLEITETCVPAKLICVKYTGADADARVQTLINFFIEAENTGSVELMSEFTLEDFQTSCNNARLGK